MTRRRRERRRGVLKPGISPTDRNRREAAALHAVEAGARRERSWLHVSETGTVNDGVSPPYDGWSALVSGSPTTDDWAAACLLADPPTPG